MVKMLIRNFKHYFYKFILSHFDKKIKNLNRHKTYEDYVKKQLEKTLDPVRVSKLKGEQWNIKVDGFRKLFKRNHEFIKNKKNSICLGSRTGHEVFVLRELGINSIGLDLAEFQPYTIKGDIHDIKFKNSEFDLVFTNILDHSLYLEKFISEMERISVSGAHIILNLQVNIPGDDYSENIINDSKNIVIMFKQSNLILSRKIKNSFDEMNLEMIFQKY